MSKKYKTVLISGSTMSGKSTLLYKYIEYLKNEENILIVIIDPKEIEFNKYSNLENVFYIANDYQNVIISELKKMIENNSVNKSNKIIIIVDEYAEVYADSKCKDYIEWLLENKDEQNVELVLATQLGEIFSEKYTMNSDVIMKLN